MVSETLRHIEAELVAAAREIRAGLADRSESSRTNPTGDRQLSADVRADSLLEQRLGNIDGVGSYASEERPETIDVGTGLAVAVDPLDGSSNLRSNNPMGTIVGVYDRPLPASGESLVAAYFVLYGPITTLVAASGDTVEERLVTEEDVQSLGNIRLPEDPTIYGFGGRVPDWPDPIASFVGEIESELKLRYGGAMVADVNQVLTHGGIFSYPTLRSAPEGKLRLQFEGAPMGYILEAAGGASSNGTTSLLAVEPSELHQRTPVYLGNISLIERLESALP